MDGHHHINLAPTTTSTNMIASWLRLCGSSHAAAGHTIIIRLHGAACYYSIRFIDWKNDTNCCFYIGLYHADVGAQRQIRETHGYF